MSLEHYLLIALVVGYALFVPINAARPFQILAARWKALRRDKKLGAALAGLGFDGRSNRRDGREIRVRWDTEPDLFLVQVALGPSRVLAGLESGVGPSVRAPWPELRRVVGGPEILDGDPHAEFAVRDGMLSVSWRECDETPEGVEARLKTALDLASTLDDLAPSLPGRLVEAAATHYAAGWLVDALFPGSGPASARLRSALKVGATDVLERLALADDRHAGVQALGRLLKAPGCQELAIAALALDRDRVHLALGYLARYRVTEATPAIVELSGGEHVGMATGVLGILGGPRARARLIELLVSPVVEVRLAAIDALAACGAQREVAALHDLIARDADMAPAAQLAIQSIVDRVGGHAGAVSLAAADEGAVSLVDAEAGAVSVFESENS